MTGEVNRRQFVEQSVLASAGAALAMAGMSPSPAARADDPPPAGAPATSANAMPCGKIGELTISRLLLGGNLLTHFTHSRDLAYVYSLAKHYNTPEKILETLAIAEENGINTLVVHYVKETIDLLKKHRARGGKMQWITCTCHALVGSGGLQAFAEQAEKLVDAGTDALYISGVEADTLCGYTNPNISAADTETRVAREPNLKLLSQAIELARSYGLPTGLGAHRLGPIQDCEQAGLEVDFYLKTFHGRDYPTANLQHDSSFCQDPVAVAEFMQGVKKPWLAFKVMAAGAIPPQTAFQHAFGNGADFVLAGMFDFEIAQDARIVRELLPDVKRVRPWQA